jgi:hypothetical protein
MTIEEEKNKGDIMSRKMKKELYVIASQLEKEGKVELANRIYILIDEGV